MELAGLLTLVAPAILPAVIDAIKMLIGKLTGQEMSAPRSVDDIIKLKEADTARLKVLAELDRPVGEISRWVADLRASFRYVCIGLILIAYLLTLFVSGPLIADVTRADIAFLAKECVFFIIGDRVYTNLKSK